jgi:DNA repair ATPase RecN
MGEHSIRTRRGQYVRSDEYCKPECRGSSFSHCDICLNTGFIYVRKDLMDTSILKSLDTSRFNLDEVIELSCAASVLTAHYAAHEIEPPVWLAAANDKLAAAISEKYKLRLIEKARQMQAEIDELMPRDEKRNRLKKDLAKLKTKVGNGTAAA